MTVFRKTGCCARYLRTVAGHAERSGLLLGLRSWYDDGWLGRFFGEITPKGELHVISKAIVREEALKAVNLRQSIWQGRQEVELHDKVIGHYLNIKHYQ